MSNGLHYFLDADGAAFAFAKEQDEPDWTSAIYREVSTTPDALPSIGDTDKYLDTSDLRRAVVKCVRSDASATYTVTMYGLHDGTLNQFDPLYQGTFDGVQKNQIIGVNVHLVSGLFVYVDKIDAGKLKVEWAPVPFETP